jgi:excinuclease ABC subunit A
MEPSYQGTFTGARRYVLHTFATTQSPLMKKRVARFMTGQACPVCKGRRLKREALAVTFAGHDISAVSQMSLDELAVLLQPAAQDRSSGAVAGAEGVLTRDVGRDALRRRALAGGSSHAGARDVRLTPTLSAEKRIAAQRIAQSVIDRVTTLQSLGLGYLSLERSTPTLSQGELQRVRLAAQIQSNLFGVVYVLDEPSAGLHPVDGEALLRALDRLKAAGNSLFVVEHDPAVIRHADWIVDVGPAAGDAGGRVLYSGPPSGLRRVT